MTINVLGIDIAKNNFQLNGTDDVGKAAIKNAYRETNLQPMLLIYGNASL